MCDTTGEHSRRIIARDGQDERDGPNEVGTQSVRVAPFSHISRVTRHSPWLLAHFLSILLDLRARTSRH